jgi:O-antigen/teichoic acid export membrane protein
MDVARMSSPFASKLRRLGSESFVYGLSAIVGRLLSFFLQPYYAHHFDPSRNGIQSVVYSYIPIISIALYLGMDVAYMRNAASLKDASATERQRVFTMSFGAVALLGGILTALAFGMARWLAPLTRLDANAFRFMIAIGYTDALLAVPFAHLRMTGRALRYAAVRLLFVAASLALNIVLIGRLHWGVTGIFAANIAANAGVLVLLAADIVPNVRPALLRGAPWGGLWRYALPLMPATLAAMLVENGDRIVLNYLPEHTALAVYHMASKDVVGIYSFNYKLGVAMLLVVQMFRLAWVPFSLQHAHDRQAPQLFARVLMALMLACGMAFLAIALLLPAVAAIPPIRDYVRPDYWRGLPIVPVILLGYIFSGMYTVVTAGLYIERRTHVLAWIAAAGAMLNLLICVVAAPRWGMVSVAWATPAAYALMAALGAWQANRVFPVPFEWGRLAQLGVYVAVLFAVDRWVQASGVAPLSAAGLTAKLLLLLALPVLLLATGFFRRGELEVLRGSTRFYQVLQGSNADEPGEPRTR